MSGLDSESEYSILPTGGANRKSGTKDGGAAVVWNGMDTTEAKSKFTLEALVW